MKIEEAKIDAINEEIKRKVEIQEDREDDPEDFEEFVNQETKISKVPIQEECNSFGFLPEKHKLEVLFHYFYFF